VIRSGGSGFGCVAPEDAGTVDEAGLGRGGWKDCGGYAEKNSSALFQKISVFVTRISQ
jgi:hypothetical protein